MIATRRIRPRSRGPVPPLESLSRGNVTQRGDQVGIVAACQRGRVLLWPIRWQEAERVADIPISGWTDLALLGNPRAAMVQVGSLLDVPHAGQRKLGEISRALLDEIERAAWRDAEASRTIRRWTGEREYRAENATPPPVAL